MKTSIPALRHVTNVAPADQLLNEADEHQRQAQTYLKQAVELKEFLDHQPHGEVKASERQQERYLFDMAKIEFEAANACRDEANLIVASLAYRAALNALTAANELHKRLDTHGNQIALLHKKLDRLLEPGAKEMVS